MPEGKNEKCLPAATGRQSFKRQTLTVQPINSIASRTLESKKNQGFRPFL